tara:strand:+ start:954 stop:1175 length:222 start_codon:yes stop_codon:yes gene_type:complete
MRNAKKYIALVKKEDIQNAKARSFEMGYYYNSTKKELWESRALETNNKLETLELELTDNEKEHIEQVIGIELD